MSRMHDILMGRGRDQLGRVQGRSVDYIPLGVTVGDEIMIPGVLWTAAEDMVIETDQGLQNVRSVIVNVRVTDDFQPQRGGVFMLDVDRTNSNEAWTIHDFLHADGTGESGFVRCRCTRPLLRTGVAGHSRPRQ